MNGNEAALVILTPCKYPYPCGYRYLYHPFHWSQASLLSFPALRIQVGCPCLTALDLFIVNGLMSHSKYMCGNHPGQICNHVIDNQGSIYLKGTNSPG